MFLSFCCYNLGGVGALVKYVWGRCVREGLRWVGEMRRSCVFREGSWGMRAVVGTRSEFHANENRLCVPSKQQPYHKENPNSCPARPTPPPSCERPITPQADPHPALPSEPPAGPTASPVPSPPSLANSSSSPRRAWQRCRGAGQTPSRRAPSASSVQAEAAVGGGGLSSRTRGTRCPLGRLRATISLRRERGRRRPCGAGALRTWL